MSPARAFPSHAGVPTGATGGALSLRTIDYHIKQPKAWTYNVNVQRELAAGWAAMVGYAGSRGYDLVNTIEGIPSCRSYKPMAHCSSGGRAAAQSGVEQHRLSDIRWAFHV